MGLEPARRVKHLAQQVAADLEYPPLEGPAHAPESLTRAEAELRPPLPEGGRPPPSARKGRLLARGKFGRHEGPDPWMEEVLRESGGTLPTREAFVALPKRAVLAAYACLGVGRREAEQSHLYALAVAAALGGWRELRALKEASADHRTRWIMHGGPLRDAQLSFIGRALPPAPAEARRAALEQHRLDFSSTFRTDLPILERARSFAMHWARAHLARAHHPLAEPDWPTVSSCLERGSGKGGQMRFLLQEHAYDDLPAEVPMDQTGAVAALKARFVQWALGHLGETPEHRVQVLSERGVKTRVVTVGPAWCQVLGHTVRKRLLRALRSCAGTYAPLAGASDTELVGLLEGGHAEVLVSTDLTRATDLLPLDLVSAVVDGLAASGRLSELEVRILRALTGPQRLHYGSAEVLSTRGILMGLPTSWCILSIIHLWWVDEVKRTSPPGDLRRAHRAVICGDDALIATTRQGAARYKELVLSCGGQPSAGKHYECQGGGGLVAPRRGVFLERLYEFAVKEGRLCDGCRISAMPVKGVTSQSLPREYFGRTPVRCGSAGIRTVLCLESIAESSPAMDRPIRNYIRIATPWLPRYADVALRLVPGYPLALGGFRWARPTREAEQSARAVRRTGRSFTLQFRRESDPEWRMAAQFSREGRELAVSEGQLVDLGHFPPLWEGEVLEATGRLAPGATPVGRLPVGGEEIPVFAATDLAPWPGPTSDLMPYALATQVALAGGREDWVVSTEDERLLATTTGMYAQLKAFSDRRAEIFTVRARGLRAALARLREEGASLPESGLPMEVTRLERRIAWRVPHEVDATYGTDWLADSHLSCQGVLDAVVTAAIAPSTGQPPKGGEPGGTSAF